MIQTQPRVTALHTCEMCTEMISSIFDFCGFCAQETGFRNYPTVKPVIGSPAVCYHGETGIVTRVYVYSRDVELSVDESHGDVYGSTICHTTNS